MANLLPILAIGGGLFFLSRKKRRKKKAPQKVLPSGDGGRGVIFTAGDVDVIEARVGERFSVLIPETAGLAHVWSLEATPPGESVVLVTGEYDKTVDPGVYDHFFIFEAKKPGSGALVFHFSRPFDKNKEPPEKVLEIQTKVS